MALEFSIEIDDKGTPKLKKFQKETKNTASASEIASKAIAGIGAGLAAAGAAAGVAGGALFSLTKEIAGTRDRITKMGRELGVTTEFLSGMGHAAQLGGADLGTVEKALGKLSKTALDADSGLMTAKRAFSDLGIEVKDANGVMKSNDELLFEIADKFKEMPDGVIKAAKAQEIFGRSGKQLINTLNQGSDALREQIGEAEALGVAFSQEAGEQAEAFNDALLRLETSAKGSLAPIGEELIPVMTRAFGELQTAVEIGGPAMIQIFELLKPAIEGTLDLIVDTAQGWAQITKEVADALDMTKEFDAIAESVTDEEVKRLEKIMDAKKKAREEDEKATEKASKQAEKIAQQRELEAQRRAQESQKRKNKAKENEAKELERLAQEELRLQEKLLEEIATKFEEEQKKKEEAAQQAAQNRAEVEREITLLLMTETERRKFLLEEEYNKRAEVIGRTIELEKARANELAELEREQAQRRQEDLIAQFENIGQITSNVSSTLANITQAEQNQINQDFDNRKRKVEEFYQAQLKGAEGNAAKTEAIQRTRDEKLRQLDLKRERDLQASAKRTASARKRAAQLEAVVNTAAAVTKALPNIPLSIAVGLQGASQIALIESQQFFKGGMTDEGQQMISVGENGREFVVSAGGTRQAGEAALEDINNGRLEDAANRLLSQSGSSRGGMTININGGVIDEQFMENSLIPKLKEFERRI